MINNHYAAQAKALFSGIGVHQPSDGGWAFTDDLTARHGYIHHSREPAALAAYAAINPGFAADRFPGWALIDMVDEVPCMDATEHTALAMACGAPLPTFPGAAERGKIFGQAVWDIVEAYSLEGCFEYARRAFAGQGSHHNLHPRGFNLAGDQALVPKVMEAMRKSYCEMSPLQQVMVLTIMHLYRQGQDKVYLIGDCPTDISAVEAMGVLRNDGAALPIWGHLVTHYAGW